MKPKHLVTHWYVTTLGMTCETCLQLAMNPHPFLNPMDPRPIQNPTNRDWYPVHARYPREMWKQSKSRTTLLTPILRELKWKKKCQSFLSSVPIVRGVSRRAMDSVATHPEYILVWAESTASDKKSAKREPNSGWCWRKRSSCSSKGRTKISINTTEPHWLRSRCI